MARYRISPEPVSGPGDIVAGDAAERKRDKLLLGRLVESGPARSVWLDTSGEQVVAVLGKRGTGKSYTLGTLLEGLACGPGECQISGLSTPRAGLVLDIMDIFWTSCIPLSEEGSPEIRKQFKVMDEHGLSTRELSVDLWIPAGFDRPGIDPDGIRPLFVGASELSLDEWGALFELDVFSEPRGMLIADAIDLVSRRGYTDSDRSETRAKAEFSFDDLLRCVERSVELGSSYGDNTIRSIRQRLKTYASIPAFAGETTALTQLLQPFRVSVLMLGRLPDALKKVLVAVLLRRIQRERGRASFARKRLDLDSSLTNDKAEELRRVIEGSVPRTWVLMDEAHILAGSDESSVAKDALIKWAKEGRNYGMSLAVATQQPSAIAPQLMSQVETLIVHQLTSPADAAVARKGSRSPAPDEIVVDGNNCDLDTLLRRLGQGQAIFSSGNAPSLRRSCVVGIRPRISAHGGYEA